MLKLPKKHFIVWIFLGYFITSLGIHKGFVSSFPHHIHAWAHCDHYAISKGFVNNGFDFFHPETFVYNKQFPNGNGEIIDSKITSMDFPINNYIVAILFKVFNTDAPIVYRLYMLVTSCIGLCFLFLISYHFVRNIFIAFLIPMVVVFTPIYLDYQVGFLPSTFSLSLFFASVYYFIRFHLENKIKFWLITLVILMFSAMIRTPFAIHLIAIGGYLLINNIVDKKVNYKLWGWWFASFILPVVYFAYNIYLRNKFGSIFLGTPMLVTSWEQVVEILEETKANWSAHFLNSIQYLLYFSIIVVLFAKLWLQKVVLKRYVWNLILWISISFIGVLIYASLMIPQLVHHDYYLIDTFYPIIFIIAVLALSNIKFEKFIPFFNISILLVISILTLVGSGRVLTDRREVKVGDAYALQFENYQNFDSFLKENSIAKKEKILVIDSYAPNMSFLLSDYSGYALTKRDRNSLADAMQLDFKYAVVSIPYFFTDLYSLFPEITKHFNCISMNRELLLLEKKSFHENSDILTIGAFLKLENTIKTINLKEEKLYNSNYIPETEEGFLNHETYGMTYAFEIEPETPYVLIRLYGTYKIENQETSVVHVIDVKEGNSNVLYKVLPFEDNEKKSNEYLKFEKFALIPSGNVKRTVTVFLYNPNQEELFYKDLKIDFY